MASSADVLTDSAFDPELTAAMALAFDKACQTICGTHQVDLIKEIFAKRIVELARQGETDVDTLYVGALHALGIEGPVQLSASVAVQKFATSGG